jgi:hypothetical protein
LDSGQTEANQEQSCSTIKNCLKHSQRGLYALGHDFRRNLYKAPFVLECIGIAVVTAYTYEAWRANQLTQRTLATTQRSHLGITNTEVTAYKPDDFRVDITFENQGNSASTEVRFDLQITDWDAAKSCKIISVFKSVGFGDFPFQTGTVITLASRLTVLRTTSGRMSLSTKAFLKSLVR